MSSAKLLECILQGESGSTHRINYLLSTLSRFSFYGLNRAAVVTAFFFILSFNYVDLKMNKVVLASNCLTSVTYIDFTAEQLFYYSPALFCLSAKDNFTKKNNKKLSTIVESSGSNSNEVENKSF